ncbi:hypothetical protein HOLleu_19205 [Holothuria leucospilota]|uniref:Uncharacterized protein n=1 Tax=Holothuria leucospilota TaxID=206669 RepID=A0A9Q1BZ10_HOLLE|nr:hypothetical protein HOLleu_19205 [Holothuria leucospilota]
MGYICPKCGHVIPGDDKRLIWHLQYVHSIVRGRVFTESVTCNQNGCQRTFSGRTSTLRNHLRGHIDDYEQLPMELAHNDFDNDYDDNFDEDGAHDGEPVVQNEQNIEDAIWESYGEDEVQQNAAMLTASLLASSSTSNSTVNNVVGKSGELISDIASYIKYKITKFAAAVGILGDEENLQEILADIDSVSQPFKNFETEYKQRKFFQTSDAFIAAQELPIGIGYYPRNNPATGNVQQLMKTLSFQYIPIKQLLRLILHKTDILKLASVHHVSQDNLMRDFHDGSYCRKNEV